MRISLQPGFILHHRPYRETSVLLEVFTKDYGRIALIARGVRTNRSKLKPLLQSFNPLLLSFQGKTDLMTLQSVEPAGQLFHLKGECLLSGFYLNELLIRLLQKQDPHPQLYTIYENTLLELSRIKNQQKFLRLFEKKLLDEIGYGLQLHTIPDGKKFFPDRFYRFHPEQGFELCENQDNVAQSNLFPGFSLLSLERELLEDAESLKDIKRLMRIALGALLGSEPLQSRKLFTGVKK